MATINGETIDTDNKFMVGVQGNNIVFLMPVPQRMSKKDALVFAAWIGALADDDGMSFEAAQTAVNNV